MRMQPRALVVQHLAAEGPGTIGDLLESAGLELTVVELDEGDPIPELDDFALMVVMGGPMDVWQEDRHPWMAAEKAAIRKWVRELGRPYVGVCLGHQLLADALGGRVGPMPAPEVGVSEIELTPAASDDPLFSSLPARLRGLQWHGAQVLSLPSDGVVLAANAHCGMQGVRIGPSAWGVQFHLEVSAATVAEWSLVPEYRAALAAHGSGGTESFENAVALHLSDMRSDAATLLAGLVAVVRHDLSRRQEALR